MTREDLKTNYLILGKNDGISLYNKNNKGAGLGYCGTISLVKGKAKFEGKNYADIESLDKALREWAASLEWPVGTYDPMLNESYRTEMRITSALTDRFGFKASKNFEDWNMGFKYLREIGPDFALSFNVSRTKDDKISLYTKFGALSYMQDFDDANAAVNFISTVITTSVLQMATDMVDMLALCPESKVTEVNTYIKTNNSIFGWEKADFKSLMINSLEKTLKELKGEEQK
jgi:hypothetical protein